jgi:predicted ATPase/uncharacterized protein HemY
LDTVEEANQLLNALGFSDLRDDIVREIKLAELLQSLPPQGIGLSPPPVPSDAGDKPRGRPTLPSPLTELIGRECEVEKGCAVLRTPKVRLVTLTGPSGIGKSRVALKIAEEIADHFVNQVYYVDLTSTNDHDRVIHIIAQVLGVTGTVDVPLIKRVMTALGDKPHLLVLDNFEQVLTAASVIEELLRGTPKLKIMITSQASLPLDIQYEFQVPPLSLPDCTKPIIPADVLQSSAVRLFIERVRVFNEAFDITDDNAAVLATICRRLDGLPLAIEIVASTLRLFVSPQVLLERLHDVFQMSGTRKPARTAHTTLQAAFNFSYHLLEEREKLLFMRLSVFASGGTEEAIRFICGVGNDRPLHTTIFESLAELTIHSLLQPRVVNGEPHFMMLSIIREFAAGLLQASGSSKDVWRKHAQYYADEAMVKDRMLQGPQQGRALTWFETEHDELRVALVRTREQGEYELAMQLAQSLWRFWLMRGYLIEGRQVIRQILDDCTACNITARKWVLHGAAALANAVGDYPSALEWAKQALVLAEQSSSTKAAAYALIDLGEACIGHDRHGEAIAHLQKSEKLCRELSDSWLLAWSLYNLGRAMLARGNFARAEAHLQESLSVCKPLGDRWLCTKVRNWLGNVTAEQGGDLKAVEILKESKAECEKLGDKLGMANALYCLGRVAYQQGDYALAHRYNLERRTIEKTDLGNLQGIASAECWLGQTTAAQGSYQEALPHFLQSLTYYQDLDDALGVAMVLGWLGGIYGCLNRYDEAWTRVRQSYQVYQRQDDNLGMAFALFVQGELAYQQQAYASARGYHAQRLGIEEELNSPRGMAHGLVYLGRVDAVQGLHLQAQSLLTRGLELYKNLKDDRGCAVALRWLGFVTLRQKDYGNAEQYIQASLALYQQQQNTRVVSLLEEELALLATVREQPERETMLFALLDQHQAYCAELILPGDYPHLP